MKKESPETLINNSIISVGESLLLIRASREGKKKRFRQLLRNMHSNANHGQSFFFVFFVCSRCRICYNIKVGSVFASRCWYKWWNHTARPYRMGYYVTRVTGNKCQVWNCRVESSQGEGEITSFISNSSSHSWHLYHIPSWKFCYC